uniref:DNA-binding response regulator n=1 Tax=Cupriavidus yeoncheonensis TaxID=1462994 RepID=UPI003F499054
MLRTVAGMQVVGAGTDPDSDLPAIEALRPDVVLVGLRTGQSLQQVRLLTATLPESIVVVLSNSGSSLMRRACLRAGGSYCFDKTLEVDELHSTLLEIAMRGQPSSGP